MRIPRRQPIRWNGSVARRMHDDQLVSDVELVREILRDQQPQWADGPITEITSTGTDHALYRLGDDAVARVPLRVSATQPIDTEFRWLPWLAERLPVEIPRALARLSRPRGSRTTRRSTRGLTASAENAPIDRALLAVDLARVLRALHGLDPFGGPPSVEGYCCRGGPASDGDASTREAIASAAGRLRWRR